MTTLPAGHRLGPYEIAALLGSGGMGSVYRALDTRLGRAVAIKQVRADRADQPSLRHGLEREARAVATLNHPHICTLHDVVSQDGSLFLVMELVEGQPLARRIDATRGGLPIPEALEIAAQVAEALAAAHRAGVIHRDVKPANIMLTKTGAKLLDFGVARLRQPEGAETVTISASGGDIAGTLPYMAPEQLDGQSDARTDVYALGCVIFEMLAGRRAFPADSTSSLLAAVASAAVPPVVTVRPDVPRALNRALTRCLAKEPDRRWQSASDLADELRWIAAEGAAETDSRPAAPVATGRGRWAQGLALAVGLLLGGAGYFLAASRAAPEAGVYVDDLELPPGTTHWAGLALSPDGRHVATVTQPNRPGQRDPRLWVREIGDAHGWTLVSGHGDEIPRYPFWSPDGRSLAYFVDDRLVRVDLPSLTPVPVCPVEDGRGGVWLDDGTIVFAPGPTTGLWTVPATGGTPTLLLDRGAGEAGLKFPVRIEPRRLVYWSQNEDPAKSELLMLSLDAGARPMPIVASSAGAAFDRGILFFWRDGVLLGQPLDIASGQLSGPPAPVAVDVPSGMANIGAPGVSAGGGHVAVANRSAPLNQLTWVNRAGVVVDVLGDPQPHTRPDISNDGRRVVVDRQAAGRASRDVWLIDLELGSTRQLTTGLETTFPLWSPNGTRILFRSLRGVGGNGNIYQLAVDDPARVEPVVEGLAAMWPSGWLPSQDGAVFHSTTVQGQGPAETPFRRGILVKRFGSSVDTYRAIPAINEARLSPDATHVAWVTNGPAEEVMVDMFPAASARPVQVSRGGGGRPRWRGDGRELFFVSGSRMMAVAMPDTGNPAGTAVPLFTLPAGDGVADQFAVAPDGSRFLIVVPASRESATIKVSRHWRLAP